MYFSEVDGKKTGKYALALSNRTIQLTDFEGNDDGLYFYNYHASVYASDNMFRDCKDITIMKSEIEKLFYIYPDKVFGSLYS